MCCVAVNYRGTAYMRGVGEMPTALYYYLCGILKKMAVQNYDLIKSDNQGIFARRIWV